MDSNVSIMHTVINLSTLGYSSYLCMHVRITRQAESSPTFINTGIHVFCCRIPNVARVLLAKTPSFNC